ncbi:MAG TPA: RluA family pseudouridine synthase, partial [Alphaproteobacteria bacterium]
MSVIIAQDDHDQRIDRWLKKNYPDLGFGQIQKLLRTGQIRMDGKRVKTDTRLIAGAELRLPPMVTTPTLKAKESGAG